MIYKLRALLCGIILFACLNTQILWGQERVKIALWGDSRENYLAGCELVTRHLLYKTTDWDFQIHTGDFTSYGRAEDWERSLNYPGMDSVFIAGKFLMCTSNHDAVVETYDKYTAGILPINSLDSTTHFFHYQLGKVHVIACDGYFTDSTSMNTWLEEELASIPEEEWLIAFWHNPCYGDLTNKDSYLEVCAPWLEKIYAHGGDFIFHGHSHSYVRTYPLLPDGTVDHEKGMVHIVNGCGGAPYKPAQPITEKTAYTPSSRNFACVTFITIEGNTAYVETEDARNFPNTGTFDTWLWDRTTGVRDESVKIINSFTLNQCIPNPFNPSTTISYNIPESGNVQLNIFDISGKKVATLVDEFQSAGFHSLEWIARDDNHQTLSSGLYFYRLQAGKNMEIKKMLLVK